MLSLKKTTIDTKKKVTISPPPCMNPCDAKNETNKLVHVHNKYKERKKSV